MTIGPGDSITASVQYLTSGSQAGQFELSITDNSRANDSFTTYVSSAQTQNPGAQRSSAEWIVEAPSLGNNIASLANFGSVTFTGASATINGVTGAINNPAWQSQAINMATGRGVLEDTTSVLVASGTSFVVTYGSAASGAAVSGGSRSGSNLGSAAPKAVVSPSPTALGSSADPSPDVVAYGVTPVPKAKRTSFGGVSDPLVELS
jgi:hypothetical protein